MSDKAIKLTMGKDRKLRDEAGNVVGILVGLEVEVDATSLTGGSGAVVEEPQQSLGLTLDVGGRERASNNGEIDAVREVWNHYVAVMKPRHTGLDPQQRAIIREALKMGTKSELMRCIDGCASSDFHMGKNDRKKKYNSLSQILKAKRGGRTLREQIDFFLDLAERNGAAKSGVPSGDHARLSAAKRDVLDALDFPSDDHVQDRGRESEAWLRQNGITFDRQNRRFLTVDGPTDD